MALATAGGVFGGTTEGFAIGFAIGFAGAALVGAGFAATGAGLAATGAGCVVDTGGAVGVGWFGMPPKRAPKPAVWPVGCRPIPLCSC